MSGILTRKQFNILDILATENASFTQRELEEKTGWSLGTVNRVCKDLAEHGWIKDGVITAQGLSQLEPYRAKRIIFVAAGFGERLVPITFNTPKPLVRVHGIRLLDRLIDAALAAGIEEIYIVRGYLAEQFDQLLYKYPMIKFLENPMYNEANYISSVLCARYLLSNAYVSESDLLVHNPKIIKKYNYRSNYLGFPVERSDDWCAITKDGIITEEKMGGLNCHQMVGISYWDEADGKKLAEHVKQAFEQPGGKELAWEFVPLKIFKNEYKVEIRECLASDVQEIDTFRELKAVDKTYDI